MNTNKRRTLSLVVVIVSFLAICSGVSGSSAADNTIHKLRLSHIQSTTTTWHKAFEWYVNYCKEQSNGRLQITIYPNSQLGSEMEVVQNVITGGGIDMCISGESMSAYVEELGVMSVPYAITSEKHLKAVLVSDVAREWADALVANGLKPLAAFIRGPRDLTANKPVRGTDDLKGMIVRTPDVPYTMAAFAECGAKPVVIAFNELLTALQQGTADAQENPLATSYQNSFHEAQKYFIKTEHLRTWMYTFINVNKYNSLPADIQNILVEGARLMQDYEHELYVVDEAQVEEALVKAGVTFIDVDQKAFREKMQAGVIPLLSDAEKKMLKKIAALDPDA